jgi:hypothetical protein
MDGAQAERFDAMQGDLFGVAEAAPRVFVPKREHILSPLNEILAAMRAANAWPWDPVQTDLKRNHVWPHLLGHLPAEEAAAWKVALEAEAARLDTAIAGCGPPTSPTTESSNGCSR